MNVTLIPFFLAANLVVNDVSEWKFGPEYSYNLSVTHDIREDTSEHFVTVSNSTVRCQPGRSDTLFCHLDDMTVSVRFTNHSSTGRRELEKRFAIRFTEHGVAGLSIEPPFSEMLVNVIRKIANQLSMDVNGIRDGDVRARVTQHAREESTSMGTCMTEYVVQREELEANAIERDRNFQLELLSGIAMPGTSLSISKIRRECIDSPEFLGMMEDRIFEMERFSSVVSIDDAYKTFTIINGYMRPSKASASNCTLLFQEVIELDLDSIKPADRDLSSTFRGEAIDLSINADVPGNFIG